MPLSHAVVLGALLAAPHLTWHPYDEALSLAARAQKHVLVNVVIAGCPWCRRMDSTTYRDPRVIEELDQHFVLARVDAGSDRKVTYQSRRMSERQLAREVYEAFQYPTLVFLAPDAKVVMSETGFVAPVEFRSIAGYVGDGSYERKLKSLDQAPRSP